MASDHHLAKRGVNIEDAPDMQMHCGRVPGNTVNPPRKKRHACLARHSRRIHDQLDGLACRRYPRIRRHACGRNRALESEGMCDAVRQPPKRRRPGPRDGPDATDLGGVLGACSPQHRSNFSDAQNHTVCEIMGQGVAMLSSDLVDGYPLPLAERLLCATQDQKETAADALIGIRCRTLALWTPTFSGRRPCLDYVFAGGIRARTDDVLHRRSQMPADKAAHNTSLTMCAGPIQDSLIRQLSV